MSEYIETLALDRENKAHSLQAQVSSVSQSDPSMSDTSQADDIPHEVVSSQSPTIYLKGARLHMITAAIFLSLFITNLEIPIVTTSLVSITDDLNPFNQVNWIASAYMLGEVSMLMIWSKLSDIFGRKLCTVTSISLFTIFAGACGSSRSMTQLVPAGALSALAIVFYLPAKFPNHERDETSNGILNAVFLGIQYFVTIFQLHQRFQVVDNTTALNAAFRLIPFTLLCPVGSIVSTVVAGKAKVPPIFLIMIGSSLQIVGFTLLSTLTISRVTPVSQYRFQVIASFGVGINLSTLLLITPYSISEPADKVVAVSSITQFRILGGVLGIAIATAAYKSNIISDLDRILTKEQRSLILESTSIIKTFDPKVQIQIRGVFAKGYNVQFRILVAFAAAQIPSSLLMWQEKQIVV
ncbi:hypothetical protein BCON_0073g00010 [Botryotinia convoluta]|uniref:Major facilitator superfamily (MFS) profile domain-containing protein n=1 Tax=Botryotinia convoluta TaxID=54673 RepID=A0A4Z1IJ99_9HELO|nr:hypothetical protein BCON_0073g00010 [Botryotinia convoluta]